MNKILLACVVVALISAAVPKCSSEQSIKDVEKAVYDAQAAPEQQQEESYQQVYEAFTKLMQNVSNNSMSSFRRLVSRLNQLVGTPTQQPLPTESKEKQAICDQSIEEKTEQILTRLDQVNKNTDQNTMSQLNDDVNKLVSNLNNSYLRNIRRVIERVNKVVGQPSETSPPLNKFHQQGDRLDDVNNRLPGFPGWDEFMVAMDRMQKSLAHFVRSSTRLITSG